MYKIFDTIAEYNQFTDNGTHLTAGILYLVKENKSLYFLTNNIDGEAEKYEYLDEIPEGYIKPEGNIIITENGENINVNDYATASVNVPIPEGYIKPSGNKTITQNGTNIDVNNYATATVNVPQPTGNISITENGENIDIAQYATATVNVAGSGGNEDLINLIERDIKSLNIPNGTTKIGDGVFKTCNKLTSINIPNSVTSIGADAFTWCEDLTNITIPNSVTSIGDYAFNYCSDLTSVTIGNSVTSIGNYAFSSCNSLTSVTIPNSVTSIGRLAIANCLGLTSITIEATTPPTLANSNAFFNTNNCIIYVPAESLEAYKTATNWSSLADRIQPIPTE